MQFLVMIRRTYTGYSVDVPDLPGCVATAKTVERAKLSIARAIEMHLELIQQSGQRVPKPRRRIQFEVSEESPEDMCTWVEVAPSQAIA
jgi:predicted RNase H-like HicB family nuclease